MEIAGKVSAWTAFKNASYIVALFVYTGISAEFITILAFLMIVDTVTGVLRSARLYGGVSITSTRLGWGIVTKLLFLSVPFLVVIGGKGAGYDFKILADWSIKVMALSELYSILSNIISIHTKKDVPEFDAVTFVLEKIRNTIFVIINKK